MLCLLVASGVPGQAGVLVAPAPSGNLNPVTLAAPAFQAGIIPLTGAPLSRVASGAPALSLDSIVSALNPDFRTSQVLAPRVLIQPAEAAAFLRETAEAPALAQADREPQNALSELNRRFHGVRGTGEAASLASVAPTAAAPVPAPVPVVTARRGPLVSFVTPPAPASYEPARPERLLGPAAAGALVAAFHAVGYLALTHPPHADGGASLALGGAIGAVAHGLGGAAALAAALTSMQPGSRPLERTLILSTAVIGAAAMVLAVVAGFSGGGILLSAALGMTASNLFSDLKTMGAMPAGTLARKALPALLLTALVAPTGLAAAQAIHPLAALAVAISHRILASRVLAERSPAPPKQEPAPEPPRAPEKPQPPAEPAPAPPKDEKPAPPAGDAPAPEPDEPGPSRTPEHKVLRRVLRDSQMARLPSKFRRAAVDELWQALRETMATPAPRDIPLVERFGWQPAKDGRPPRLTLKGARGHAVYDPSTRWGSRHLQMVRLERGGFVAADLLTHSVVKEDGTYLVTGVIYELNRLGRVTRISYLKIRIKASGVPIAETLITEDAPVNAGTLRGWARARRFLGAHALMASGKI